MVEVCSWMADLEHLSHVQQSDMTICLIGTGQRMPENNPDRFIGLAISDN